MSKMVFTALSQYRKFTGFEIEPRGCRPWSHRYPRMLGVGHNLDYLKPIRYERDISKIVFTALSEHQKFEGFEIEP